MPTSCQCHPRKVRTPSFHRFSDPASRGAKRTARPATRFLILASVEFTSATLVVSQRLVFMGSMTVFPRFLVLSVSFVDQKRILPRKTPNSRNDLGASLTAYFALATLLRLLYDTF